jgi:hypothetical protein
LRSYFTHISVLPRQPSLLPSSPSRALPSLSPLLPLTSDDFPNFQSRHYHKYTEKKEPRALHSDKISRDEKKEEKKNSLEITKTPLVIALAPPYPMQEFPGRNPYPPWYYLNSVELQKQKQKT